MLTTPQIIGNAIYLFTSWVLLGLLVRWTTRKDGTVKNLLGTPAIVLFFFVSRYAAWIVTAIIHEAGHARACIALGGNVGGFEHWLHTVWTIGPGTDCSIKPYPLIFLVAGPVISIVAWLASALIVTSLIDRAIVSRGICRSIIWGWWSWWYFSTLTREAYHAYAAPSVLQDTTRFVHATGINPNLIALPLTAIFAASLWPWWRIQHRLLPEPLIVRIDLAKVRARSYFINAVNSMYPKSLNPKKDMNGR
jgi:hypothetical protein